MSNRKGNLISVGALWAESEFTITGDVDFDDDDVIYTGKMGESDCVISKNHNRDDEKYPHYLVYVVNSRYDIKFAIRNGALWKYRGDKDNTAATGRFGRANLVVIKNRFKENEKHPDMYLMVGDHKRKERDDDDSYEDDE